MRAAEGATGHPGGVLLRDARLGGTAATSHEGDAFVARSLLQPRFPRVPLHVHPHQEETIAVVRGTLRVRLGRATRLLGAGERVVVPPGTPHTFAVAGGEPVEWVAEFRPPLQQEALMADFWRLARAGHLRPSGRPRLRALAPVARRHAADVRLARVPARLQRAALRLLDGLGRVWRPRPRA